MLIKITYLFIPFILYSCNSSDKLTEQKDSKSKLSMEKVYGEYYYPGNEISLDLTPPNKFLLGKQDSHGDVVDMNIFSEGTFNLEDNTIILSDSTTQKNMLLQWLNEEKLIAIKIDSVMTGQTFLVWNKLYPNGGVKYSGGWENGKKEGIWQFYDEKGQSINMILYSNDSIVDKDFKYKD